MFRNDVPDLHLMSLTLRNVNTAFYVINTKLSMEDVSFFLLLYLYFYWRLNGDHNCFGDVVMQYLYESLLY